jgi:hypothetical protein
MPHRATHPLANARGSVSAYNRGVRVLALVIFGCGLIQAQEACPIRYERLVYPPIRTPVEGVSTVTFVVDGSGRVLPNIQVAGPQVFKEVVRDVIQSSEFAQACEGTRTVAVEFHPFEDELGPRAELRDKDHYVVWGNWVAISDPPVFGGPAPWCRRAWRAIFRR